MCYKRRVTRFGCTFWKTWVKVLYSEGCGPFFSGFFTLFLRLLFSAIFKIWRENRPLKWCVYFTRCLPIAFTFWNNVVFMFVWTRSMLFWQPCRKFFSESPKKIIKLFFQKKLSSKSTRRNYLEKRFHPYKRHLQQNWWAENMLVLAGRLVVNVVELDSSWGTALVHTRLSKIDWVHICGQTSAVCPYACMVTELDFPNR